MTRQLFSDDAYLKRCSAQVVAVHEGRLELDRTVFYPRGGGQPGDTGFLLRAGGERLEVIDTVKSETGGIAHLFAADAALPATGEEVEIEIDWDRRYRHMRMHTCLHLLGAVLPYGVTGGQIGSERSRLDFDMQETVDKDAVTAALHALIAADHPVQTRWITDEELDAQPELIRTMSVQPPRGAGRVRLLEIAGVDLQPCGGTHVRRTGEIGAVCLGKVQKKGARNRRVHVEWA